MQPVEGRTLMSARRYIQFVVWLLTLAAGVGIGTVIGQQSPPTESKGLDAKVVSTIDLAPDNPGYELRMRNLVFEPGGVAGIHSHKERPAFAYILDGTLTEFREGGYVREYKPGEVVTESRDVTHWGENRGTSKLAIIGVDIIKKP
jgi:quercetin dioxygenase-like cupin family protein